MPRALDPARRLWCVLPECAMVTVKSLPLCRPAHVDTLLSHYVAPRVSYLPRYGTAYVYTYHASSFALAGVISCVALRIHIPCAFKFFKYFIFFRICVL